MECSSLDYTPFFICLFVDLLHFLEFYVVNLSVRVAAG